MEVDQSGRGHLGRGLLLAWLHLAVLWSFAVAQPLFDVLAESPDFFVARGNTRGDILVFAFALVLVPPTLAILVELALARLDRVRRLVHLAFVGVLVAAIALQLLDDLLGGSSALLIPLSLAVGAAAAVAYARGSFAESLLTVLSPAPVVFLVLFLLVSDVSKLVLPQEEAEAGAADVARPTPIVMVVLDEFRVPTLMDASRKIDAERFPNLAALSRSFTWYRNATTVADQTTRAVPAILTGRVPRAGELPIIADHPRNLFTMLAGSYSMNVREAATALCPESVCERSIPPGARRLRSLAKDLGIVSLHRLLPDDLDRHLPAVDQTFGNFGDAQVGTDVSVTDEGVERSDRPSDAERGKAVESFVRTIRPGRGRPRLDFLHVFLPHIPWIYLPSGRLYPDNGIGLPGQNQQVKGWGKDGWSDNRWLTEQAEQRFALQAQYVDRLLGDLIAHLRRSGLYDRALVIVTADHGVSFHPGGPRRAVTRDNIGDIAGVPLFVKLPRQREGGIDDAPVRTTDLLPTIADVVGVRNSWRYGGQSLAGRSRPDRDTVTVVPGEGPPLSLAFPDYLQARDRELRRSLALFGSGDLARLYRVGPDAELVGKPLSEVDVGRRSTGRVALDGAQQFASLNTAAQVIPAFVTGRLDGVEANTPVAIAVNGRIRAVAAAFDLNGAMRLAALVPESALRRGTNSIRVFEIQRSGGRIRLATLQQEAAETYRLVQRDGTDVLVSSTGQESRVVAQQGGGFLEELDLDAGALRAGGWSATASRGAASRVVAFVKGKFAAEAVPATDRPDVTKLFGDEATRSGFRLNAQVPAGASGAGPADVRVFGIFGAEAVELQH